MRGPQPRIFCSGPRIAGPDCRLGFRNFLPSVPQVLKSVQIRKNSRRCFQSGSFSIVRNVFENSLVDLFLCLLFNGFFANL